MDVPISLAIILSAAMSLVQTIRHGEHVYFDACITLLFFLLIGRYLDQRMRVRAKGAAQNLLKMRAKWATLIQPGRLSRAHRGGGACCRGCVSLVAAGERFPLMACVLAGKSEVDESLLTGESLPRAPRARREGLCRHDQSWRARGGRDDQARRGHAARRTHSSHGDGGTGARPLCPSRGPCFAALSPGACICWRAHAFIGWMVAGAGWEFSLLTAIAVLDHHLPLRACSGRACGAGRGRRPPVRARRAGQSRGRARKARRGRHGDLRQDWHAH